MLLCKKFVISIAMIMSMLFCPQLRLFADVSGSDAVIHSYHLLEALHSYRANTTCSLAGLNTYFRDEWTKNPPSRHRVVTYGSNVLDTIKTLPFVYQHKNVNSPWTKRKSTKIERIMLIKGIDFVADYHLDQLDFTYAGMELLGSVQMKVYTFSNKSATTHIRNGKVCIGAVDNLPHRFEEDNPDDGTFPGSIIETYDNFNAPIAITVPVLR